MKRLVEQLFSETSLTHTEYARLLAGLSPSVLEYIGTYARRVSQERFGNKIYLRGLIEITNYCKNNCYYCGIRRDNRQVERYRLNKDILMETCWLGNQLGIKTFVLQGGEDAGLKDNDIEDLVRTIRKEFPDTAITLSLGEKKRNTYQQLFDAGANRYLLRHETADSKHYAYLHPREMLFENRMNSLKALKEIGYQTGVGMMIGSPGQTIENLVDDILFIEQFQPEMIGMGPYIPQKDTPFANEKPGSLEMTLLLISIFRLLFPGVLMPATTSLATLATDGYEQGILAGANVIMLNLTPSGYREKYALYDNKRSASQEAIDEYNELTKRMNEIGYCFSDSRGDYLI